MKVLVGTLNSKFIHSSPAVAYLSAAAEKRAAELDSKGEKGFKIERAEFTINNSDDYIYNEIAAAGYDAVCFACYIWNIEKTLHVGMFCLLYMEYRKDFACMRKPKKSISENGYSFRRP